MHFVEFLLNLTALNVDVDVALRARAHRAVCSKDAHWRLELNTRVSWSEQKGVETDMNA